MKNNNLAVALTILLSVATLVIGFIIGVETHKTEVVVETEPKVHTRYTAYGRYYTDGTVITDDGYDSMAWEYNTDSVSGQTPYDNMPVWIGFDDNGTPDNITDDIVLGLVYDRETAIYDALETELGDDFQLERDGNNIRIQSLKRGDN